MDSADLDNLICCCPGLRDLNITGVMRPGADVSGLLQLPTSCTTLNIGGAAFTDAAAPVLAQLTHLEYLSWCSSEGLTDAGFEQLTALTGVNRYGNCGLSDELFGTGGLQPDADAVDDPDSEEAKWAVDNNAFEICDSPCKVCAVTDETVFRAV